MDQYRRSVDEGLINNGGRSQSTVKNRFNSPDFLSGVQVHVVHDIPHHLLQQYYNILDIYKGYQ
jgi:hypothetical protein